MPSSEQPPDPPEDELPAASIDNTHIEVTEDDPTGEFEEVDAASEPEEVIIKSIDKSPSGGLARIIALGILGAIVLFILAIDPGNVLQIEEVAAFVLAIAGVIELVGAVRQQATYQRYIQPVVAIVAGVVIWIWPEETLVVVGLVVGAVLIIRGLIDLWSGFRRWNEKGANTWVFVRGLILIATGGLALLIPTAIVPAAVFGGAILLIARAVIGVWFAIRRGPETPQDLQPSDTYSVVAYWLSRRQMAPEDIEHIEDVVFLHRGDTKDRISRFAVLMGLSTAIATFGIAVDSTAVVIGAMLVAPLMTPILGISAGLIHGRTRSTMISTAVVLGGAGGAVGLSWALSSLVPNLTEVVRNAQVVSRTAPNLLDLGIAVAAGAAGAYGVSRAERSDALPGVAVAIALVPPLSVVGITLHAGDFSQAAGATLLFLTNLFSIILMAGLVFIIVGYTSWSRLHYRRNRIRTAFAVVILGVVLISIPLALTAQSLVGTANDVRNASTAVNEWLEAEFGDADPIPVRVNDIEISGDVVVVQLIGWEQPPDTTELRRRLLISMGRPVTASVRWLEEQLTGVAPPADSG